MKVLRGRDGDPAARLQDVVDMLLRGKPLPRVLEAGCGSTSRIRLPPSRTLVGVDISQRQLAAHPCLDERILGDIEQTSWPSDSFDLVVCWDVIEHLPHPKRALEKLFASLRPGGGVVLAFPNFWSLKGLVTKLTPYWFHVWFYRVVIGDRRRTEDLDQFPTTFRADIALHRVAALARSAGLEPLYEEVYEGPVQMGMRQRRRLFDLAFGTLGAVSRCLSVGRVDLALSDCILVMRRPQRDRMGTRSASIVQSELAERPHAAGGSADTAG